MAKTYSGDKWYLVRGIPIDPMARFWKKVNKTDGCWLWTGRRSPEGYGFFNLPARLGRSSRGQGAHRTAYEHLVGPVPPGLELDHLCRMPSCVNPDHLEAVSHAENMRRGKGSKTECKRGHPFTPENTYFHPGEKQHRDCRICYRTRRQERSRKAVIRAYDCTDNGISLVGSWEPDA